MAIQRTKKELADDVAQARAAAASRLKAPAVDMGSGGGAEVKKLQKLYASDTLPRWGTGPDGKEQLLQPKMHAYGADQDEYHERIGMGYEPVVKPDGSIVRYGTRSILMKCPQELFNRQINASAAQSKERLKKPRKSKDGSLGKDNRDEPITEDRTTEKAVTESLEEVPVT